MSAQISYTKFTSKPTANEDEIKQIEVQAEVVGINKMSLVHDVIRAIYEKGFKEQTPIGFAPPLSSQMSALRHGHGIDPGWVEVQKVLLDQVEQCCHRWPRNRMMSPPEGQHPRMATFNDNIDAIAKWVKDAMTNGFEEIVPAEHIKVTPVVRSSGYSAPGSATGEEFQAQVDVSMLKHLHAHLTQAEPLPEGVLSCLAHAIETSPGPIDLSGEMHLLSELGWSICGNPRAEIDGEEWVAKTRKVVITPEEAADAFAEGLIPAGEYRTGYLKMALLRYEESHQGDKIIHGAILTPSVTDDDSFTPKRAVLLRIMEKVGEKIQTDA